MVRLALPPAANEEKLVVLKFSTPSWQERMLHFPMAAQSIPSDRISSGLEKYPSFTTTKEAGQVTLERAMVAEEFRLACSADAFTLANPAPNRTEASKLALLALTKLENASPEEPFDSRRPVKFSILATMLKLVDADILK